MKYYTLETNNVKPPFLMEHSSSEDRDLYVKDRMEYLKHNWDVVSIFNLNSESRIEIETYVSEFQC